jgi:hypothetical protein
MVGAGFAGLSAGGAVAKYFDQVDLLERDLTPMATDGLACRKVGMPMA